MFMLCGNGYIVDVGGGGIREYANYKKIYRLTLSNESQNTLVELPKGVEIFHKFIIYCANSPYTSGSYITAKIDYSGGGLVDNGGGTMYYYKQNGITQQKGEKVREGSFSFIHNQNKNIYLTSYNARYGIYGMFYGDFEFWW